MLFVGCIYGYYLSLPDYKIRYSISNSNGPSGIRETKLDVIVFRYWNYDELIKDIEEEHNLINGTPTSLEINLYYSERHYRSDKAPFDTARMEYD